MSKERKGVRVLRWVFSRFLILLSLIALFFLVLDWCAEWKELVLSAALTLCFGDFLNR